jgi:hypothetical protein
MQLKLFLEQTGQTWTLKPSRAYIIGSGEGCDISLAQTIGVAPQHFKLSFNPVANQWSVEDLGSSGTVINGQSIIQAAITAQTRISIASNLVLVATPEFVAVAAGIPASPPLYAPPLYAPSSNDSTYKYTAQELPAQARVSNIHPDTAGHSGLAVLTWKAFVDRQLSKLPPSPKRLAIRFGLLTGFRETPWVRRNSMGNGLSSFDGYIIPDFQGSVETVAATIQDKVGQLKHYKDTDCFLAELTDAHIDDSTNQKLWDLELFAIERSSNHPHADYRNFCVTSYHRVRNYLLIEQYGTDLFIGWITRFEPLPKVGLVFWLAASVLLALVFGMANNFALVITPLLLWAEVYLATPAIMGELGILPKKANALLVIGLMILPTLWVLSMFAAAAAVNSYMR